MARAYVRRHQTSALLHDASAGHRKFGSSAGICTRSEARPTEPCPDLFGLKGGLDMDIAATYEAPVARASAHGWIGTVEPNVAVTPVGTVDLAGHTAAGGVVRQVWLRHGL